MPTPPSLPGLTTTGVAGHGAHGPILRGQWRGNEVTIRQVRKGHLPSGTQRRRIRTLAGVESDHLARIVHVEETDDSYVLLAEHVEGPALTTLRGGRGGLRLVEGWRLLADLAAALAALHSRGVIHGDLSPANVIVRRSLGRAVVIDVGAEEDWELGTVGFRAPELAGGSPPSGASDIWSAGRVALWAVGHSERAAFAELLRDVLHPDPAHRPAAAELAALSARFATKKIEVPGEARLATAHLRAQAAARPTARAGRRARRRPERAKRRGRAAMGIAFLAVALLTYTIADLTKKPVASPPGAPPAQVEAAQVAVGQVEAAPVQAGEAGSGATPEEAVTRLSALRDRALIEADVDLLGQVTVPGSDAAHADRELLRSFRGSAPHGLATEVEITGVRGTGNAPVVEAVLRQGPFAWRGGSNDGVQVAPLPPRCVRIHLLASGEDWRVQRVSACAAEEMSG